jgi:hypothetical protein
MSSELKITEEPEIGRTELDPAKRFSRTSGQYGNRTSPTSLDAQDGRDTRLLALGFHVAAVG